MHALFSFSLFGNFLPKTFHPRILRAFATIRKISVKELLKISYHFQSLGGFLLSISFIRIVLNGNFSAIGKVPTTELYVAFWDIPIPGCILIVFGKLLSLWCWSCLSFCHEILELIPVLCLFVE